MQALMIRIFDSIPTNRNLTRMFKRCIGMLRSFSKKNEDVFNGTGILATNLLQKKIARIVHLYKLILNPSYQY